MNDAGRRTFLLQLDLHEKMVPVSDNNLILCLRAHGPLFGGKFPDFGMRDSCNITNSYGCFPNAYNKEGENKYVQGPEIFRAFTGSERSNTKYTEY